MIRNRNLLILVLLIIHAAYARGQAVLENVTYTEGYHSYFDEEEIISPGDESKPVDFSGTSQVDYVSSDVIRLKPGFSAHSYTQGGYFHAYIDDKAAENEDVTKIYVSNDRGNDETNDGTEKNPVKTLQGAYDKITNAGNETYHIILLNEGNIMIAKNDGRKLAWEKSGTEKYPIYIRSEDCNMATVTRPKDNLGYILF